MIAESIAGMIRGAAALVNSEAEAGRATDRHQRLDGRAKTVEAHDEVCHGRCKYSRDV